MSLVATSAKASGSSVGSGALVWLFTASNASDVVCNSAAEVTLGIDLTFTADGTSTYVYELLIPIFAAFGTDNVRARLRENPSGANTDRGILWSVLGGASAQTGVTARRHLVPAAGTVVWRGVIFNQVGTQNNTAVGSGTSAPLRANVYRIQA